MGRVRLSREGHLVKFEEVVGRPVRHRHGFFGLADVGAHAVEGLVPHRVEVREGGDDVGDMAALGEAAPMEREPVWEPRWQVLGEGRKRGKLVQQASEQVLLLAEAVAVFRGRGAEDGAEVGGERRHLEEAEAEAHFEGERPGRDDLVTLLEPEVFPRPWRGADGIEPPGLMEKASVGLHEGGDLRGERGRGAVGLHEEVSGEQ